MTRTRLAAALLALACFGAACLAAEIRAGAVMRVKPNSIWFQDAGKFGRWQALKRGGDAAALAAYQDDALRQRDAWRFVAPLSVRILSHDAARNSVRVVMQGEGRLAGTRWLLEADALAQ